MSVDINFDNNLNNELLFRDNCEDEEPFEDEDDKFENILELSDLSLKNVVKYMKTRYERKIFYTWAGQTLIAINPFEHVGNFRNNDDKMPSVHAVISKIWFRMTNEIGKSNQAVVISGDSGSGKTFSASLAIKYITEKESSTTGNTSKSVLWQTWSSIPLITAFGNAATAYNSNSSRFGKLMQLQFSNGRILGSFIQIYMLEKSRVSVQNQGEGNFHIFHQILEGFDNETLKFLQLNRKIKYKIVPVLENYFKSTYQETVDAMKTLKIPNIHEIFVVLAIILNLGNVEFEPSYEYYTVSTNSSVFIDRSALLLKTSPKALINLLTQRVISASSHGKRRVTSYSSPCTNPEECIERRNCLMRFLYDKLFSWLIKKINENICKTDVNQKLLGILDIYGFEVFNENTFEQLCINYANERLQQLFIKDYLIKQQQELQIDNIIENVNNIDENEYKERILTLDGPISVFSILNEECTLKRFSKDASVTCRLSVALKNQKHFVQGRNAFSSEFTIRHYAGPVVYRTSSMCAKNSDKVPEEMIDFIFNCRLQFLENLLEINPYFQEEKGTGKTILQKFKKSLDVLIDYLAKADLHFIKCIKPNLIKKAQYFDTEVFLNQIKANGIIEILKLDFQNYSIALTKQDMQNRFSKILIENLKEILKKEMIFGKKQIYFTERGYRVLQTFSNLRKKLAAKIILKFWKWEFKKRNQAATVIQKFFRNLRANKVKFKPTMRKRIPLSDPNSSTSSSSFTSCSNQKRRTISLAPLLPTLSPNSKVIRYFDNMDNNYYQMCEDVFSLTIENVANKLKTKSFSRGTFYGNGIVSKTRLNEITPNLFSPKCLVPTKLEKPKGLPDIF